MSSTVLCLLLVCLVSAAEDPQEIQIRAGHDVTLQCPALTESPVTLVEWSRADLPSDDYVFFYRNKRSYEKYQHPTFRGRVELKDPELTNGDASIVLMNVNVSDTGTYKCLVTVSNRGGSAALPPEIERRVSLKVTDTDHSDRNKDGNLGLGVGVPVTVGFLLGLGVGVPVTVGFLLLLVVIVLCVIIKKREGAKKNPSYTPPAENAGDPVT